MNYQKLKRRCNRFIWIASFIFLFTALMCVANGGILNDLDGTLVEIEGLERTNLLHNPLETISAIAKCEIGLVHNLMGLKKYIKEVEQSGGNVECVFFLTSFFAYFLYCLEILRSKKIKINKNLSCLTSKV